MTETTGTLKLPGVLRPLQQYWPLITQFFLIGVLVLAYAMLVDRFFDFQLPEVAYHAPAIVTGALQRPLYMLVCVMTVLLLADDLTPHRWNPWHARIRWSSFHEEGLRAVRWLMVPMVMTLAWAFAFNSYNYYYDQFHLIDRLLIVALAVAVAFHPSFALLSVFTVIIYVGQYHYPEVFVYSWTDKKLVFLVMILFGLYLPLRGIRGATFRVFFITMLALIGAFYFFAGVEKLQLEGDFMEWVFSPHLTELYQVSYVSGWLRGMSEETSLQLARMVSAVTIPLQIGSLLIELSGIALLIRRRVTVVLLVLIILLHVGIVASSGIFFWKWIIMDAAIIAFILMNRQSAWMQETYRLPYVVGFVGLVWFGTHYFSPSHALAWYDTGIADAYDYRVTTASGEEYNLSRTHFAPYDIVFAQNRFHFLNENPVVTGTYGAVVDPVIYRAAIGATTRAEVEQLVAEHGVVGYRQFRERRFEAFLTTWFTW